MVSRRSALVLCVDRGYAEKRVYDRTVPLTRLIRVLETSFYLKSR